MSELRRDRYFLGEVSPEAFFSARRLLIMGSLVGLFILGLIVITVTQSPVAMVGEGLIAAVLGLMYARRTASGASWVSVVFGERIRRWWARRGGWDSHPAGTPLFDLEDVSVQGWAPEEGAGEIGFVVNDREGYVVMVLEVEGDGDGTRSSAEHLLLERSLPAIVRELGDPAMLVDQLQLITRVVPGQGSDYRDWQDEVVTTSCPPNLSGLQASMRELAEMTVRQVHNVRSWAVLRLPMNELLSEADEIGLNTRDPETLFVAAAGVGAQMARLMEAESIPVVKALTGAQIGGLVRSLMLPDRDPDDTTAIGSLWSAIPEIEPTVAGTSMVTVDPDTGRQWWLASGSIGRSGWPVGTVLGRWLEPLVLQSDVPHRTIVVTLKPMDVHRSRTLARGQLTTARARTLGRHRRQEISTGEDEQAESAAAQVVQDVTTRGQVGVVATVRVQFAADHPRALRRGRDQISRTFSSVMSGRQWLWDDHRHTAAALQVLPLGQKVSG